MNKVFFDSLAINHDLVRNIFGLDFYLKSLNDTLSVEDVIEANKVLMLYMYGEEITNLIFKCDVEAINKIKDKHVTLQDIPDKLDLKRYGVLLIRPEVYGLISKYEEWICKNGLKIVSCVETSINYLEYWDMYFANLINYKFRYDSSTRAFNYVNRTLMLIIVEFKNNESGIVNDLLVKNKGKPGLYEVGSLRGEIAYNAFQEFVTDGGKNFLERARIELDPIGMYRKLSREEITFDAYHREVDLPILFYATPAVHVPDTAELSKHVAILLKNNFEILIT